MLKTVPVLSYRWLQERAKHILRLPPFTDCSNSQRSSVYCSWLTRETLVHRQSKSFGATPWSLFLHMEANDFLCSNINFSRILNSIKSMRLCDRELAVRFTETRSIGANNLLLEIITAYDSQKIKDKNLLQFAEDMADVILTTEPATIINKLQVVKRKRSLTNDEIADLVNLRKNRTEKVVQCAIAILLNESKEANRLLDELSTDERMLIMDYPIYNLLA